GNAQPAERYEDDRKLAAVEAEKNIDLFLNQLVTDVFTNEQGRIDGVGSVHTRTGVRRRFAARLFADCTGDGTVGYLAGADWRLGRESKAETGEKNAVDVADKQILGASCQWYAEKKRTEGEGRVAEFPDEPWMIRFNEEAVDYALRGDWNWETGMNRDQLGDFETVRDYAMLVAYSNWNHVKNVGPRKAEFADAELVWLAHVAGKRETRRLMGDYVLTQQDVVEDHPHPDGTCCTTWAIDLHYPMPANQRNYPGEPFRSICTHYEHHAHPIPYRCFYSRNVPNLFMAGRDVSVTHVALGTTRVMRTHGMMGEVVGMAAAICRKHGCDPRGVYECHLEELKALMRRGVGLGKPQPPQTYNAGYLGDDTAMLQNLLDSGKGRVEFPEGLWIVSKPLLIGSDTHLVCSPKTTIRLRDWSNCPVLMNRGSEPGGSDRNITVEGGTWDGNNVKQKRGRARFPGRPGGGDVNQLTVFAGVTNLTLRGMTLKDPDSYCIELTDVADFTVEDVVFDCNDKTPNQDGLHVDGSARNGCIRNLRGHTNDDFVALNSDEGDWRSPSSDIADVLIDGIYGGDDGYTAVRLLSRNAKIENVVIRNVYGKYKYNGVSFTHWAFENHKPGMGHFDNVVIENVFASSCMKRDNGAWGMVLFQEGVESVGRVVVRNLRRVDGPDCFNGTHTIKIGDGVKIDTLVLDNV
ncbi:MAG: FAD-dependent oxidoreductase, partial [Kiritimatiellae bacterium]|nr:FAD-dependent oxidoreductase [Kiritimatiellia bacterium]